jgi:hypothetical protein
MVSRGADATTQEADAVVAGLTRHYGHVRINELDASRLVTYREKQGPFKDFEVLREVTEIEPANLERYKTSFIY